MAVNKFFHDSNKTSISAERDLYKNLVKEAIQIHGHDVYYVNRTFVNEDTLFGEDTSSTFSESQLIEMYVENAEGGLEGEKELVSNVLNQASKFIRSRLRSKPETQIAMSWIKRELEAKKRI